MINEIIPIPTLESRVTGAAGEGAFSVVMRLKT